MTSGSTATFESTQRDQGDLDSLARDRPRLSNSRFGPNSYYGLDRVILRAASLPPRYPVNAVVPHGVVFNRRFIWSAEARAHVPAVLCYPDYRIQSYRLGSTKLVVPAASPASYVIDELTASDQPERAGTIFFAHHSTHHILSATDPAPIAFSLSEAPEWMHPITVCMYWRDIQLGRHVPFQERGFRVVTAGHIYDPLFLYRLYWLCAQHRYASANAFGTHTFFSVQAGCIHMPLPGASHSADLTVGRIPTGEADMVRVDVSPAEIDNLDLSAVFHREDPDVQSQRETAAYFLGRQHLLRPAELADLLRELRREDRRMVRVSNEWQERKGLVLPGWLVRGIVLMPIRHLVRRFLCWLNDRGAPGE